MGGGGGGGGGGNPTIIFKKMCKTTLIYIVLQVEDIYNGGRESHKKITRRYSGSSLDNPVPDTFASLLYLREKGWVSSGLCQRRWMSTTDTFQSGVLFPCFTFCSKIIESQVDGMCGLTVTS